MESDADYRISKALLGDRAIYTAWAPSVALMFRNRPWRTYTAIRYTALLTEAQQSCEQHTDNT